MDGDTELIALVKIGCPAADDVLRRLGSFATAEIRRYLDVEDPFDPERTPPALVAAARLEASALVCEAGTMDSFARAVRDEFRSEEVVPAVLAVSGRKDEARASSPGPIRLSRAG